MSFDEFNSLLDTLTEIHLELRNPEHPDRVSQFGGIEKLTEALHDVLMDLQTFVGSLLERARNCPDDEWSETHDALLGELSERTDAIREMFELLHEAIEYPSWPDLQRIESLLEAADQQLYWFLRREKRGAQSDH